MTLWLIPLMPAAVGGVVLMVLLVASRTPPAADDRPWRGVHRSPAYHGRHEPARLPGDRAAQIDRAGEATQQLDPRTILAGLERPEDMPEIGREGFHSW